MLNQLKQNKMVEALTGFLPKIHGTLSNLLGLMLLSGFAGYLLFWNSEKKRRKALADTAAIEADKKGFDLRKDHFDLISEKFTQLQVDYFDLLEQIQRQSRKYIEEINQKCSEISELKSQMMYYKGVRCYRTDCPNRVLAEQYEKERDSASIKKDCP